MAYSKELRERAIARLLPPINASLSAVSQELNIPYQRLYTLRTEISLKSSLYRQLLNRMIGLMCRPSSR